MVLKQTIENLPQAPQFFDILCKYWFLDLYKESIMFKVSLKLKKDRLKLRLAYH